VEIAAMDIMRSMMFVPGNSDRMLTKAMTELPTLDMVMLDLEDGVPPWQKDEAREMIASKLGSAPGGPVRFVRINAIATDRMEADMASILVPGLEGLVLPKVERPEEVELVDKILTEREPQVGLTPGSVKLLVAIESSRGLFAARDCAAASSRVMGLMFGAEDYALDLGLSTNRIGEARELVFARNWLVNAAAAEHKQSVDGVWPDFKDLEGTTSDAWQARRFGFTGKSTFHPAQIDIINEIFSPSQEDVEFAQKVVDAFEEAQKAGQGSIALGGQLIDLPIVERARRVLKLQATLGRSRTQG
jgi:citrate lyase subunit beta / citryl-CoA lyase